MNPQRACFDEAVLVTLRAGKNQDVLVAFVVMKGHGGLLTESNQRSGGSVDAISIKTMNLHAIAEWGPLDVVEATGKVEHIVQLDARERESWIVLGEVHKNKGWRRLATCTKQANVSASTEKELPMV